MIKTDVQFRFLHIRWTGSQVLTWIVSWDEVLEKDLVGFLGDLIAEWNLSNLPVLVVVIHKWLSPQWKSQRAYVLCGVFDVDVEISNRARILVIEELKTLLSIRFDLIGNQISL